MVFYLIGAPHKSTQEAQWLEIEKHVLISGISRQAKGKVFNSDLARFKLGNLDHQMFINDNLIKQDAAVESLLRKIERQYLDVTEKISHDFTIESKDGQTSIENFILQFRWDDVRFGRNKTLSDILKEMQQRTSHVDSDLRAKIQQYQDLRNQSQQVAKKEGNLLVRDLVDVLKEPIVKARDFVYSDYLTTLVAIVPKAQIPEWLACYEFLSENVVPKSAKQFQIEDKDNLTVWRVVLMKPSLDKEVEVDEKPEEEQHELKRQRRQTPLEEFVQKARDKLRVTVREFDYRPAESRDRDKLRHDLKTKSDNMNTILKQACEKAFSDLYITYLHLKHLRCVVDIAMRFGTQDPNLTCVIKAHSRTRGRRRRFSSRS